MAAGRTILGGQGATACLCGPPFSPLRVPARSGPPPTAPPPPVDRVVRHGLTATTFAPCVPTGYCPTTSPASDSSTTAYGLSRRQPIPTAFGYHPTSHPTSIPILPTASRHSDCSSHKRLGVSEWLAYLPTRSRPVPTAFGFPSDARHLHDQLTASRSTGSLTAKFRRSL